MTYTTNYHLPQWVESDRILMEDFNQAMETLDGGIAAAKAAADTAKTTADAAQAAAETADSKAAAAQAAAEAIDSLKWPELLGTIAGDNTILVIARSEDAVESVVSRFHALIKR